MMKDRFSPRPAKKIKKRFVPSSNFFNSIDSEEESHPNCFIDISQSTTLGKETFLVLFNRQNRGLIDPAIHSIQLQSPAMKTFVDIQNQESFKEISSSRSLVGCSTRDSSQHRSNASDHSSPNRIIGQQRSAGAHFNLIHRPLEKHEPETNGNQVSHKMPIDVPMLSSLSGRIRSTRNMIHHCSRQVSSSFLSFSL